MDAVPAFHTLLVNRSLFDDEAFLRRLDELASHGGSALIAEVARLLAVPGLHAHVKFLLLKHAQRRPDPLFVPAACQVVEADGRIRLRTEALVALGRVATPAAYRALVHYAGRPPAEELARAGDVLAAAISATPLLFHYDAFWRPQRGRKNLTASVEHLARHLTEEDAVTLLPALDPPLREITGPAWQFFARRSNGALLPPLLKALLRWDGNLPEPVFRTAAGAVIDAAADSGFRAKAFATLRRFAETLPAPLELVLSILLLRLDTPALLPGLAGRYGGLPAAYKDLFLQSLDPAARGETATFAAGLLAIESDPSRLARSVQLVLGQGERGLELLFHRLPQEKVVRRRILVEAAVEAAPPGLTRHLTPLLTGETDPEILKSALDSLLKSPPDVLLAPLERLLSSGVETEVKSLIVRRLPQFSVAGQERLALFLTDRLPGEREVRKNLLISLLEVMNRPGLADAIVSRLLERVLVMMEEADLEEVVQFVYFFDRLLPRSPKEISLIQGELRMVQNTLLQAGDPAGMVSRIHHLLRRLEKRLHPAPAITTGKTARPRETEPAPQT